MMRIGISTFLVLVILIFLIQFFPSCSKKRTQNEFEAQQQSKGILEADFQDLDGNSLQLSEFKGKTVFLNFWATWCKPCIYEMPSISRASDILGDDIVFLAASDESLERIIKFRNKNPDFNFKIIKINDNVVKYDIQVLPTTYLINPEGEISKIEVGGKEWDNPNQIEMIKRL